MRPRILKMVVSLLSVCLLLSLAAGCAEKGNDADTEAPTQNPTVPTSDTEAPTDPRTEPETETETQPEVKTPMIDFDTLSSEEDRMTTPFWLMDTMYNESTSFIVREDGSITAKLLFKPTKLISVKSNDLQTTFTEGVDYTWDGESNTLVLKEGSAIPYFTQNDIHGKDENGNYIPANPAWDNLGRSRFSDALYCVNEFLYLKQIAVTYEYEYGSWDGPVTEFQGDRLPRTMDLLKNGEEITVVFWGDSIFTGCDASAMYNRLPMQVSFPDFTKTILENKYGLHVRHYNLSVGGMKSDWGVSEFRQVTEKQPDLVFIGFGMNDSEKTGTYLTKKIGSIISSIRKDCPDCEFVVVCPMVPNKDAGFLTTHEQFPEALCTLAGDGVAYVDMFTFHARLLEVKDFISMSGNNINHPNDWLIRCYTMNLMSTLIEYGK